MKIAGLDIGTTTLCGLLLDSETGEILSVVTEPNSFALPAAAPWESLQDAGAISRAAARIIDRFAASHGRIGAIGIAGQMHGILYVDRNGEAVSPLYTWQDGRGDREMHAGVTYAGAISEALGRPLGTGMGLVTHLFNVRNRLVPAGTVALCTITDYAAMRLAQRLQPLMDATNAASLGGFNLPKMEFRLDVIKKLGMDPDIFPRVAAAYPALGETSGGTPVFTALGDNQASFLGSVRQVDGSLLVNVGTGSQLSLFMTNWLDIPGIDTRPFPLGGCIGVGAALCGGKAWSILHEFFERTVRLFTGQTGSASWEVMNGAAPQSAELADPLVVDTQFAGTRAEPNTRGGIAGIGTGNFTPENLIAGVREGIAEELLTFLKKFPAEIRGSIRILVGSGNGIRLNRGLRKVFEDRLGMEMRVPAHREETSFGAGLLAGVACGALPDLGAAGRLIRYLAPGA